MHEALFLSDKEETTIINMMQNIRHEYHSNIDKFSQDIIIAQLELLLNYADRFYHRQFITRKITNHKILAFIHLDIQGQINGQVFSARDRIHHNIGQITSVLDKLLVF